jgi:serine O-acetyltransferase
VRERDRGGARVRCRRGGLAVLGLGTISRVARELRDDLGAARQRDPAARRLGSLEVLFTYPGVHALLAHRLAHGLFELRVPLAPRALAYASRALTGIEIHPAATIGCALLIDHGGGVVIGETAEIGDQVTLYQGVTLGGTGFARGKRHPTVEDEVVIGSGAKLLGPIRVGRSAKVGANSVVIHDVPPHATVVGNPGRPVRVGGRRPEGPDADWAHLPDPVADAIGALSARVAELEEALEAATGRKVEPGGQVTPLRRAGGSDPAAG